MDLDGRIAIVTGASSGIGRATASMLADEGARVGLAARSREKLESVADGIREDGGEAVVVPTDVSGADQVAAIVETVTEAFGGLDVLVNSAGVGYWDRTGVGGGDVGEWCEQVEVNLLGLMYGTHYGARAMEQDGGGDIVNVSSLAGQAVSPEWPAYVASKWGVKGFTQSVARALREHDVRATLIEPGTVNTPMQPEEDVTEHGDEMLDPAAVAETVRFALEQPGDCCVSEIEIREQ